MCLITYMLVIIIIHVIHSGLWFYHMDMDRTINLNELHELSYGSITWIWIYIYGTYGYVQQNCRCEEHHSHVVSQCCRVCDIRSVFNEQRSVDTSQDNTKMDSLSSSPQIYRRKGLKGHSTDVHMNLY